VRVRISVSVVDAVGVSGEERGQIYQREHTFFQVEEADPDESPGNWRVTKGPTDTFDDSRMLELVRQNVGRGRNLIPL
jgi:hypothetical protein